MAKLTQQSQADPKLVQVSSDASPLDFLKAQTAALNPAQSIDPQAAIDKATEDAKKANTPSPEIPAEPPVQKLSTPAEPAPAPAEPTKVEKPMTGEELLETVSPARANFRKLEQANKEKERLLKEKEDALQAAQAKIKDYETGTVLPEVVQQKENELASLRKYRDLFDLRSAPGYNDKFIRPLQEIETRIEELSKAYNVPKEELLSLTEGKNEAEVNGFLSGSFDALGAQEVKGLLNNLKTVRAGAKAAEAEPSIELTRLLEENKRIQQSSDLQRKQQISSLSKKHWENTVVKMQRNGNIPELLIKEHDEAHNAKVALPIWNAASQEYGKFVSILAEHGANNLPEEFFSALSNMVALAHGSAVAFQKADGAIRYAEEVSRSAEQGNRFLRPFAHSGSASSASVSPVSRAPVTPESAADTLINNALAKRRA